MPMFRIATHDGVERELRARRVRAHGPDVLLEERRGGRGWTVVESIPRHDVAEVRRRIVELDGTARWITQPLDRPSGLDERTARGSLR
jgi:hypothetical protein